MDTTKGIKYALFYPSDNHDRVYNATSFEYWIKKFFTTGVFTGDLQVTANNNMTVTIGAGYINIGGKVKFYEQPQEIFLETAHATYDRIDCIVIERNDSLRDFVAKVITGGYSSNPSSQMPVRENGIDQRVLAQISVVHGAVRITQADITDTRTDPELCGIVAGTVKEMDFSQFQAQFDSYFENYKVDVAEEFAAFTAEIQRLEDKGQLSYDEMISCFKELLANITNQAKEMYNIYLTDLREFYSDIAVQGQQNYDAFNTEITSYIEDLTSRGNTNLAAITQQLLDFRNTNEAGFLAWLEEMKNKLSEYPPGEFQLQLDQLKAQQEDMMEMLLSGSVYGKLITDDGNYIVDDKGLPILIGNPICKCEA